jgi:CHAD domain-containing protein
METTTSESTSPRICRPPAPRARLVQRLRRHQVAHEDVGGILLDHLAELVHLLGRVRDLDVQRLIAVYVHPG